MRMIVARAVAGAFDLDGRVRNPEQLVDVGIGLADQLVAVAVAGDDEMDLVEWLVSIAYPAGDIVVEPAAPLTDVGWIVEEGLSPGDVVVVEGFQKIQIGSIVQPAPWTAASTVTAGPGDRP